MVLFIQLYVYDDSHLILRAAAQKRIRKLDVCVFSFYYMSMVIYFYSGNTKEDCNIRCLWSFLFYYMSMTIVIYFLEWQHKRGLQH
jgi:hypothetical protein